MGGIRAFMILQFLDVTKSCVTVLQQYLFSFVCTFREKSWKRLSGCPENLRTAGEVS